MRCSFAGLYITSAAPVRAPWGWLPGYLLPDETWLSASWQTWSCMVVPPRAPASTWMQAEAERRCFSSEDRPSA